MVNPQPVDRPFRAGFPFIISATLASDEGAATRKNRIYAGGYSLALTIEAARDAMDGMAGGSLTEPPA
jgi:hypothetical protein